MKSPFAMIRHFATLLLLVCFAGYAQQTDSLLGEVPADLLFKKPFQSEFSISPNGKLFAEVIKIRNTREIAIVDIDGHTLLRRIPMGERMVEDLVWLSDKRLMFQSLGSIFAIDLDGQNEFRLAGMVKENTKTNFYNLHKNLVFNNVLALLPENDDEILVETFDHNSHASIKRVNVFTGEKIEVLSGSYHNMNGWYVNRVGNPVLGMRTEDTSWHYCSLNRASGQWEPIVLNLNGKQVPFRVEPLSFLERNVSLEGIGYDGEIIYISTNMDSDKRVLLAYDLAKGEVLEELVNDVNVDVSDEQGDDLDLIFDSKNRKLAGIRYEGITPQHHWYSGEFSDAFGLLRKKYPSLVNDIFHSDRNNERFLVSQWSDVYAGNIGVFDLRDSSYSVMIQFNEDLNAYKLNKIRNTTLHNRDGVALPSYVHLPQDYDPGVAHPLVVIPHGGPWARDYWRLDEYSQFFSTRGYVVLRVNYRGSFGFGRSYAQAGYQGINTVMIDDIADATHAMQQAYNIDPGRIHIFGHSYGGYAAYLSLARYRELYASVVAVSAPTDIAAWMKYQRRSDLDFSYTFWKHALGGHTRRDLDELSPLNMVADINRPVLVFHGDRDKIIPVTQAEAIRDAFEKHDKQATVRILQQQGHSIRNGNSISYVLEEAVEFFEEHRKP